MTLLDWFRRKPEPECVRIFCGTCGKPFIRNISKAKNLAIDQHLTNHRPKDPIGEISDTTIDIISGGSGDKEDK